MTSVLNALPDQLSQLTALLTMQTKQIETQSNQISELTKEVDGLKALIRDELSERTKKDETIRKLELELEQGRS